MLTPFVTPDQLAELLGGPDQVVVADCRWYLDGRSGHDAYTTGHLPGSVFVDVNTDLAGPVGAGTGRHPLPTPEAFAAALGRLGIGDTTTVIGYDDEGGVIAARLVWMLRALGASAAVLDGGLAGWQGPLETVDNRPAAVRFTARPWPRELLADLDDVAAGDALVVDARPADRFRGEGAQLDPRNGHIPGAVSLPCRENLDAAGRLLDPGSLRDRFEAAGVSPARVAAGGVISSCGSGVTACHNLLTIESVGLGRGRLYPGSWSQYATTDLPVETGDPAGS